MHLRASLAAAIAICTTFVASPALADGGAATEADTTVTTRSRDRVRVGAMVGVGFPQPLSASAFVKVGRVIGGGAEYGFLPRTNVAGIDIELKSVAGDLRVFPFRNGVFVGLRGGWQSIDTTASASVGSTTTSGSMLATTWFVNPRIGVLHTFDSGLTLGVDVGVQIPISPEVAFAYSHAELARTDAPRAMRAVANALGTATTPTIDLLRVGFLF